MEEIKNYKEHLEDIEEFRNKLSETQNEKNKYLGEYKERVIIALTKEQVEEEGCYKEVLDAFHDKEAKFLKISRDIDFSKSKDYIKEAEKIGLNYSIVDAISYRSDIGLVVSSDDIISNPKNDPLVKSDLDKFNDKGLNKVYYESLGDSICDFHYNIIEEELPDFKSRYKTISFFEKLIGIQCPICKKLGGKVRG